MTTFLPIEPYLSPLPCACGKVSFSSQMGGGGRGGEKGRDKERERTAREYAREILSTPGAAVCLGYGWFFNFACRQAGRKLKKNSI